MQGLGIAVAPAHDMNSVVWIKVLAHVLIVSSCCLIQSERVIEKVTNDSSVSLLPAPPPAAADPAQSCNNGLGRLVYEKVSDHKVAAGRQGQTETVSRTGLPIRVLEASESMISFLSQVIGSLFVGSMTMIFSFCPIFCHWIRSV